ncbi:MAG: glycosyl hydrolase, partial [Verrucomicrobiota bacterium]
HGVCLPGYAQPKKFKARLQAYRDRVIDKQPALSSIFWNCQNEGKWNTLLKRGTAPDGSPCQPQMKSLRLMRELKMVPVVAWIWYNYRDPMNTPLLHDYIKGKYDWYIDDWIQGIKEYGDPVFIRLSHEMNGNWFAPFSPGFKGNPFNVTTDDYITYWRYTVDKFREAGVTNVAWVWTPNAAGVIPYEKFYPGDDYVDWIGLDIYSGSQPKWTFEKFLKKFPQNKPVMLPEFGTSPKLSRWNKRFTTNSNWLKALFTAVETDHAPRIKAIAWYQFGKNDIIERDLDQLKVYQEHLSKDMYTSQFFR